MVNMGGFLGSVVAVLVIGQVLDLVDGGSDVHTLTAFRWAFGTTALLLAFGLFRTVVWYRRTRAALLLAEARGEAVPLSLNRRRWELVDGDDLAAEAASASASAVTNGYADAGRLEAELRAATRSWVPTAAGRR
jgi:hypothetical protein